MKKKKNILEEAADKVLEQYDNREFLEKIRAERGPSIIAAQNVRKSYQKKIWSLSAVATALLIVVFVLSCLFVYNPLNKGYERENKYLDFSDYDSSSYEEINKNLNNFVINEIENVDIIKFNTFPNDTVFMLIYKTSDNLKSMRIIENAHPQLEYDEIDLIYYSNSVKMQGHNIYYYETKNTENGLNKFMAKAYIKIDDIKIHFEYEESSCEEKSDFLNTLAMFVG